MKTNIKLDMLNGILSLIEIRAEEKAHGKLAYFYCKSNNPVDAPYDRADLDNNTSFYLERTGYDHKSNYHLHLRSKSNDYADFYFDYKGHFMEMEVTSSLDVEPRNITTLKVTSNSIGCGISAQLSMIKSEIMPKCKDYRYVSFYGRKATASRKITYCEWGPFDMNDDKYPEIILCISDPEEKEPFGSTISDRVDPSIMSTLSLLNSGKVPIQQTSGLLDIIGESVQNDNKNKLYSYISVRKEYEKPKRRWIKYEDAVALERLFVTNPSITTTYELVKMGCEKAFSGIIDIIDKKIAPGINSLAEGEYMPNEEIDSEFEKISREGSKLPAAYKELLIRKKAS